MSRRRFHRTLGFLLLCGCLSTFSACRGGKNDAWLQPISKALFPPSLAEASRDAFNVYDADVRRESICFLSAAPEGGQSPYVRMYRILAEDPDSSVRAAAIHALGLHGTAEDVPLILQYTQDPAPYVRGEAAQALQKLHHEKAPASLVKIVREDEDIDARIAASSALGQYPQPHVFDTLVGALDDQDFGVVESSRRSLVTLTGQPFSFDATAWLEWSKQHPDHLFDNHKPYTWQPWPTPRSWWQRVFFPRWIPTPPAARTPAGLSQSSDADSSSTTTQ